MNIKKENQRLNDLNDNIKILESTKTLHPFVMSYIIHTNKHLAIDQENKILNYLTK